MTLLRKLDRAYGGLLWGLMAIAAIYVGLIMVAIIYLTVFRTFDWHYSRYTHTFIEYGFIYILFLGSPWLIRNRGHVYIELLTAAVSPGARKILSRAIVFVCAAICFVWVWFSYLYLDQQIAFETFDELRADLNIMRWWTTIAFPVGFLLMGLEFLRFLFIREPMHQGMAGVASDRTELEETKANIAREGRG